MIMNLFLGRKSRTGLGKEQQQDKLAALQTAITQGIESGSAGELDIDAIKLKARNYSPC